MRPSTFCRGFGFVLFAIGFCGRDSVSVLAQDPFANPSSRFGGGSNQAYLDWIATTQSMYNASLYLPSTANSADGAAIHWTIRSETLYMAVVVRALGWLGFGLSEVGDMQGADLFTFETSKPANVTDSYILEARALLVDPCQDWNLVKATVNSNNSGFMMVEVSRALNTGDPQDRVIIRDDGMEVPTHRLIAAWGDGTTASYHGPRRARGAVRWFQFGRDEYAYFIASMGAKAQGSFVIRANNYALRPVDTAYVAFCLSWDQMLAQGVPNVPNLTTIGFEPIIDPRAVANVHHFTLHGGRQTMNGVSCSDFTGMGELIYVWAPGEPAFALPDYVGGSLGQGSYLSLSLEIHYNNPGLLSGIVDSSGVRIYYSTSRRKYESAILQLADPGVSLSGKTVGNGLSQHVFTCPSTCSQTAIPNPVTVLREHLHMHQVGAAMRNELIRNGSVVHTGQIDFWNFAQQGNPPVVQGTYQIHPGDSFRTVCNYRADSSVVFGQASSSEMCIAYIMYYPKIPFDVAWVCARNFFAYDNICLATYSTELLSSDDKLGRVFGKQARACPGLPAPPSPAPTANPCPCKSWQVLCRLLHRCVLSK